MSQVVDRWHVSRPSSGATPCGHSTRTKILVANSSHGKGKRWQVRWREGNVQRKENFERKPDAETRAATIRADVARGTYVDVAAGKESFRKVAEEYQRTSIHRASTVSRVDSLMRVHILPWFGEQPVSAIRRSLIQAWVKDRAAVLAPATLGQAYMLLVSVLRTAVFDGKIARNPADGVKLPPARTKEVVPLHTDAVRALIDAAPPRFRAMLLLGASSGLRSGELLGLEIDGVDFLRREVHVRQQLNTPNAGQPYLGPPKTHESERTVPVTSAAINALAAHCEAFPVDGVELDDRTDLRHPERRTAKLLFPGDNGLPVRRGRWSLMWPAMLEGANASLTESGSDVRTPAGTTLHDLRHYYASLLIKHRESVKTVQKRLGHAKPSITLDTYVGLWADDEDTTRDAVQTALGDVPPMCPEQEVA